MADIHKIRVKIGDAEFEAEGERDTVEDQYKLFLEAVSLVPRNQKKNNDGQHLDVDENTDVSDKALLDRTFTQDKSGVVSLKVLPHHGKASSADGLLLLLYGYNMLKGEDTVIGSQLMKAAKQSGIPIDRIDRTLERHSGFYQRGGSRRGTRYSLNNRGLIKAKELLVEMHK